MSIKTILVAASGGDATKGALETGFALARRLGAHVEIFHAAFDERQAIMPMGDTMGAPVSADPPVHGSGRRSNLNHSHTSSSQSDHRHSYSHVYGWEAELNRRLQQRKREEEKKEKEEVSFWWSVYAFFLSTNKPTMAIAMIIAMAATAV